MSKSDKQKQVFYKRIRLIILISVLVFSTFLGILHQVGTIVKPAGVDSFCPFGGLESAITFFTTGTFLKRIVLSTFILLIATIIVALVFRRSFCGNLCAFGALQEFFGKLGKKIFKKHFTIPGIVDKPLRYLKYVVLVVVVYFSWKMADLVIRPYDPWVAYQHLIEGPELFNEFLIGAILLFITLIGSMLYDRFFCKYLCPMGGFLGLINRIGWFRVKRNPQTCIDCNICDKACPMNIKVSKVEQVQSSECINCNLCVNSCPVKDTLTIGGPKNTKISSSVAIIIALIIFLSPIAIATATGSFQWTQENLEQIKEHGNIDPDDIKGRYTFKEVSEAFGISKQKFLKEFKITDADFELAIKDVFANSDMETEEVRDFVKKELGLTAEEESNEEKAMDNKVIEVTDNEKKNTAKEEKTIENENKTIIDEEKTTSTKTFDVSSIKGMNTLKEVSEMTGIPIEKFLKEFGFEEADINQQLKVIKDKYKIEIESIRNFVAKEIK